MTSASLTPLFLSAELAAGTRELTLAGEEAVHALRARRLGEGDTVHLTNGEGLLATGRIVAATRSPATLNIAIDTVHESAPPATAVILASALPKGDRQQTLLDMATQLGVGAFVPLDCARSVVRWQARMADRWQRVLTSAAKQCRQSRIPRILESATVAELLQAEGDDTLFVVGESGGRSLCRVAECIIPSPDRLVVVVGPEGGFDAREQALLEAHSSTLSVRCGDLVLRTETAALALLAAVNQWLDGRTDNTHN